MTCLNPTMKVGKQLTEAICQHRKLSKDEAKKEAVRLFGNGADSQRGRARRTVPATSFPAACASAP